MKRHLHLNQDALKHFELRNVNRAHILDLITTVHVWAEEVVVDGNVYYWTARQAVVKELWVLDLKDDTVYRHLKALQEDGFIDYVKVGKKDCVRLTKKGKSYATSTMSEMNPNNYVGNESEKDTNSDLNPSKFGNESEKGSDLNPTDNTTKSNPTTKEHTLRALLLKIQAKIEAKSKATFDKAILNLYKQQTKYSDEELVSIYLKHYKKEGQYAKKFENFLLDIDAIVAGLSKSDDNPIDDYFNATSETIDAEVV